MKPYDIEAFAKCHERTNEWTQILPFLVLHFVNGSTAIMLDLIKSKHAVSEAELSPDLLAQWESLQLTVNTPEDLVKRNDLVNRGYIFRSSIEELCKHIIPVACRSATQLEVERRLMHSAPLMFHPNARQKLHQWICQISQVSSF